MNKVFYSLLLMLCSTNLTAQIIERQVIAGMGGSHYNSSLELDFTVGEAVTASVSTGSFKMTQGFQQAQVDESVSINPKNTFEISYKLYPNPTTNGKISIDLYSKQQTQVRIKVVDVNGKVVYQSRKAELLNPTLTYTIDISKHPAGNYFILINDALSQHLKSIPFIKTN